MIRIALLDLGNVLVKHEFRQFAEAVATRSIRSAAEIQSHQDEDELYQLWETGKLSEVEFFEHLRMWLGWPKRDVPQLKREWNDMFAPMPEAEAALESLCRSHHVWILSDTNPLHLRFLRREYPFIKRAERIFASFQTGTTKRDPKAFEFIIREARCAPQEIFFVDDLPGNIARARSMGMQGIVFGNWKATLREIDRNSKTKTQRGESIMATKKKAAKKPVVKAAPKPKKIPVGKGPIGYTTSNIFNAPVAKVWAAAVEKKHLKKHFIDDMKGEFGKDKTVSWFWKEWGWWDVEVLKYKKNKELVMLMPEMGGKYSVTVRYEILKKDGKTIFRIHESGYPAKDLNMAFMMCEGWSEFHTGIKAHLKGVDLRKV